MIKKYVYLYHVGSQLYLMSVKHDFERTVPLRLLFCTVLN